MQKVQSSFLKFARDSYPSPGAHLLEPFGSPSPHFSHTPMLIEGYNMVEGNIPEPVKDKVGAELQRAKRASWDKLPEGVRKPKQFV